MLSGGIEIDELAARHGGEKGLPAGGSALEPARIEIGPDRTAEQPTGDAAQGREPRPRRPRRLRNGRVLLPRPRVRKFAASDTALATAVCEARRLVAGYSDTHSRGESKFDKVMQASERLAGRRDAAEWVLRLTKVALKDADGTELDGALRTVDTLFEDA